MNFYAGEFPDFATAYAVLIAVIGVISIGLLTAWVVYEVNTTDPIFEIRRKTNAESIAMPQIPKMLIAWPENKRGEKPSV